MGIVSWSIFLIQTAYLAIETYHETWLTDKTYETA
jgi:hypothetical protein